MKALRAGRIVCFEPTFTHCLHRAQAQAQAVQAREANLGIASSHIALRSVQERTLLAMTSNGDFANTLNDIRFKEGIRDWGLVAGQQ